MAEQIVQSADLEWVIGRTAFPFVASFPMKLDLVRGRIEQMHNGTLPPQFTDHLITPTFVDELSQALQLLLRGGSTKEIYHLVGDTPLTDFDITSAIVRVFQLKGVRIGKSSIVEFNKSAPRPYQQNMALSNRKFESQFGDIMGPFDRALETMRRQMETVG